MIKTVCIVGGGTAGWMAATYLSKTTSLDISVIESRTIPIIGVGESTVPSFCDFLETVGLTEDDLFTKVGSVRKYTANHNDWNFKGHSWWHHFIFNKTEAAEQLFWMQNNILPNKKWRHSYHIDANKFAILLRDSVAPKTSIKHYYDTIIEVKYNENGVQKIVGEKKTYDADLYIDCTGFNRTLLKNYNICKEHNKNLINNKAWACHADYTKQVPLLFTRTFAMNAGWQWNICLKDRVGVGYVFSDRFISSELAKTELLQHCPYKIKKETLRLIDFKSEWYNEAWYKNIVGIGLSAGFLEPLESQSIFLTQMQIQMLSRLINKKNNSKTYNKFWNIMIKHLSEYLEIHYTLSSRTDTEYWRSFNKIKYAPYNHTYSPLFHDYSYNTINEAYSTALD
jgi:tryptophan halogenase